MGKPIAPIAAADMGDRLQIAGIELQRRRIHLALEIVGQTAADLRFDHPPCVLLGYAEEADQHLLRGDRIAVPGQHIRMRATGDHLAVHEHAVAIEDDEIDRH